MDRLPAVAHAVGASGGVGRLWANPADGARLFWVVTRSQTPPNATQIRAGQDADGAPALAHAQQPVRQTGWQTTSPAASGLPGGQRHYFHFAQAEGPVSSAPFDTDADGPGTGQIAIRLRRRYRVQAAPEGLFFTADLQDPEITEARGRNAYDESFHAVLYVWDFGDPHAVSDKVVNLPLAHNDLNRGYGKHVAHVYTRPGRYTVTCTAYKAEGVRIGTHRMDVVIGDPGLLFAGPRTILVDPDGRGDPERHRNARVVPDFGTGLAALAEISGQGQLLLKRGTGHGLTNTLSYGGNFSHFRLGAWGDPTAPPPLIAAAPGFADLTALIEGHFRFEGDAVFQGLHFRGLWDSTTETGTRQTLLVPDARSGANFLVDDCRFEGFFYGCGGFAGAEAEIDCLYTINNSDFTDWSDFAVNPGQNWGMSFALLGSAVHQHKQALQGGTRNLPSNAHGPVRVPNGHRNYMACCDLFSRNGWSAPGGAGDQPCFRPLSTTDNARWSSFHAERCALEGGTAIVQITQNGPPEIGGCNFVMEKCLLVGTAGTAAGIVTQYTGLTFRNMIFVRPDAPLLPNAGWFGVFLRGYAADNLLLHNPELPVECYSNTLINRLSDANRADKSLYVMHPREDLSFEWFPVFSMMNNIVSAPEAPGQAPREPELSDEALICVGGPWQPRFEGLRYQDLGTGVGTQWQMDRRFATPADTVRLYAPQPGSDLIDSAIGTVAIDDFFGRIRRSDPDQGAIET